MGHSLPKKYEKRLHWNYVKSKYFKIDIRTQIDILNAILSVELNFLA